ncbi:hypothetical protein Pcinc_037791 [Petrolisthes cinctipes]|uniref:Uncharacterized protein n=1 Tax=Petrolisthes cinctipes TaxID=88211 RepID=A0AAE1BRR3_PETCI|nr:hypothetical protein Pcinc_037791 [Petrolisthes cinctipes]
MDEDNQDNPLSSLEYHTLIVLGTEDYPSLPALQHKATPHHNDGRNKAIPSHEDGRESHKAYNIDKGNRSPRNVSELEKKSNGNEIFNNNEAITSASEVDKNTSGKFCSNNNNNRYPRARSGHERRCSGKQHRGSADESSPNGTGRKGFRDLQQRKCSQGEVSERMDRNSNVRGGGKTGKETTYNFSKSQDISPSGTRRIGVKDSHYHRKYSLEERPDTHGNEGIDKCRKTTPTITKKICNLEGVGGEDCSISQTQTDPLNSPVSLEYSSSPVPILTNPTTNNNNNNNNKSRSTKRIPTTSPAAASPSSLPLLLVKPSSQGRVSSAQSHVTSSPQGQQVVASSQSNVVSGQASFLSLPSHVSSVNSHHVPSSPQSCVVLPNCSYPSKSPVLTPQSSLTSGAHFDSSSSASSSTCWSTLRSPRTPRVSSSISSADSLSPSGDAHVSTSSAESFNHTSSTLPVSSYISSKVKSPNSSSSFPYTNSSVQSLIPNTVKTLPASCSYLSSAQSLNHTSHQDSPVAFHPLYSHDKVPRPVPVATAFELQNLRRYGSSSSSFRRRRLSSSDCASSCCSEKTLVGSQADSGRIFGSGGDSASSPPPDIIDSSPVYENPSELDSEYYYKSPKGKKTHEMTSTVAVLMGM